VRCVIAFVFGILIAMQRRPASAQPPEGKWDAGGIVGLGKTWDDETDLGNGVLAGARVQWLLTRKLRVEADLDWLRHSRRVREFETSGHTLFLTGALKYRFRARANTGYLLGGPVLAIHTRRNRFSGNVREISSTQAGYVLGGGVSVSVRRNVELGPEARMIVLSTNQELPPKLAVYVGLAVAFKP
jgi:hypothetical protein